MRGNIRAFVFVGVLGGLDVLEFHARHPSLTHSGERALAMDVAGQTALGLIAVYAGYLISVR